MQDIHLPVLKPLLLASIIGAGITLIGMEFFLFRFDDSHAVNQVLWFGAMFIIPLGPALHCLLVYSRSKVFANLREDGPPDSPSNKSRERVSNR
jgi:hypothetical protein